jgi:glycosyl hydrolase family 59/ricin-type beta-trefoil lectin protein/glycosyl hydrolase family 59 (putative galactocerebrosidase)
MRANWPLPLRDHLLPAGAVLLAAAWCVAGVPAQPAAAATTTITVNGTQGGRVFDGIGAISGGGGNTRLLTDYPAAQQSQILDYLFKPGYGADLQILKVEIGGDTNSTDGSESSIEHTPGTINCNNGYEWWLMEQAQSRNPSIKFYGLAWGAPGWIGGGNFWSTDMINYLVAWLNCAKSHGLTISYLGGWNEKGFNESWFEQLHSTLAADGFTSTKVVAADQSQTWAVADSMVSTPAFNAAVDIVGVHYPCGYLSSETSCPSTSNALATGKPLWASENGSQDYNNGAAAMARADNRDYLDGKMTATINWPIVASVYPNLPFSTDALVLANQPSSGAYTIGKQAWVTAQTTQFTAPGWTYIDSASGYLQGNRANGSYVTLKSPNGLDWSSVIETMDATAAQTVSYTITGGLSTGTVHVWSTNVSSGSPSSWFVHSSDITPSGGSFSLTLQPGFVYSLTTTTGQGKGTAASPAPASLALPYSDSFDGGTAGSQPRYLAQQQGVFEVGACAGGRSGQCVDQLTPAKPIEWTPDSNPYTIGGDMNWANYTVSADALMEQAGSVELAARVGQQHAFGPAGINEYYLQLASTGAWSIVRNNTSDSLTTLASGTVAAPGLNTWHHLALTVNGSTITAAIDGTTAGSATDGTYGAGMIGLGTSGYQTDEFDNLSVTPVGTQPAAGAIVAGVNTAKCVDDNGDSATDGTKVQMWDCNGGASQNWSIEPNGTIQLNGKCLDITGAGTANGTLVELWTCNAGANQIWHASGGTLVNPVSGKCLDDPAFNTANGTQLDIWTCNGGSNQQWRIP